MRAPATLRRAAASLIAAALVTGCASIPTSGPVTKVADDTGLGQSTVRYSPALPTDDASPSEIVRGYLDAMLAYPSSTRTVTAFLTPSASREWHPQSGVVVYDGPHIAVQADERAHRKTGGGTTVDVTVDELGRIGADGRFTQGRGGRALTFHLEQVDGQWRIDDPVDGLLVTEKFFADYFRAFDVYFFDQPAKRLVPIPVHLPVDDRLAAALIGILARGPGTKGLVSFVPGPKVLRPTVPVDDGVADVGFLSENSPERDSDRLSAQVVWTLRQVPALRGVRISIGQQPLSPAGSSVQSLSAWSEYDTDDVWNDVYGLRDGHVVQLNGSSVEAFPGTWGRGDRGLRAVAVGGDLLAVLDAGRSRVRVVTQRGKTRATIDGSRFLSPVVDADGAFWLVDRTGGRVRVRIAEDDAVRTAPLGRFDADLDVRSFAVSPDGARYLVTVGSGAEASVRVGRIERSAKDVVVGLGAPRVIETSAGPVRSAVWVDGTTVAYLGPGRSGQQVLTRHVDGSSTSAGPFSGRTTLPDIDPQGLAIGSGPSGDRYVTGRDGTVWYLGPAGSWGTVESKDPVTGLSVGR